MTDNEQESVPTAGGPTRRSFMVAGAAAAAVAATASAIGSPAAAAAASPKASTGLKVGAGKTVLTPTADLFPINGFTDVHDDLYARVLLVENNVHRIALVVLDLTSISEEAIGLMRTAISTAAGVASADIMVTVTHNFSSPHVMDSSQSAQSAEWVQLIVKVVTSAATAAVANLQDAEVGYGTGKADVNVNRNVLTADGYWLGVNEQWPSDKSVNVARFNDLDGNPIAILTNYNVQSCVMQDSVMNSGDLPITADLAGAAVAHVESQYPGAIGFWLVGACGDQFPGYRSKRYTIDKDKNWTYGVDLHDAGFALLEVQGERLGNEIVRVAQAITKYESGSKTALRLITDSITVNEVTMGHPDAPTKSYTFVPAGTGQAPIWVFQIGNGAFAGLEPELSTDTAEAIRKASPYGHTFVMSMFEGGAKNMAEASQYPKFTYESIDSFYARGTAEKVARQVERILRSMH